VLGLVSFEQLLRNAGVDGERIDEFMGRARKVIDSEGGVFSNSHMVEAMNGDWRLAITCNKAWAEKLKRDEAR